MPLQEAFVYYMRGAITLFFFSWSFNLYPLRARNRMMQLLFVVTATLSFLYLKDILLFFVPSDLHGYVEDLFSVADLLCIPLSCAFFIEATRPGWATRKRVVAGALPYALCSLLYAVFPTRLLLAVPYVLSLVFCAVTLVLVYRFAWRYDRCLEENCSDMENMSVKWVAVSATVYFLLYVLYYATFGITQLNEALFHLCFLVLWTVLFVFARQHQVLNLKPQAGNGPARVTDSLAAPLPAEEALLAVPEGSTTDNVEDWNNQTLSAEQVDCIMYRVERAFQKDKLFLQPKITLTDVAETVCTNRTYLSMAIHQKYEKSFYDFINAYRVEEACRLMAVMADNHCTMAELADRSGFNSISTFNRHFVKLKGKTPKAYWTELYTQP